MRVLLDTNIVLDFVLARQPFFIEANEIFIKLQNNLFEAFVSAITPINVFYTTRKEKDKTTAFSAIEALVKLVQITRSDNHIFKTLYYSISAILKMLFKMNAPSLKISTQLLHATRKITEILR